MKKKKLLKEIEFLKRRISAIEQEKEQCKHCENFKAKTVKFIRYRQMPSLVENYIRRDSITTSKDFNDAEAKWTKENLERFLTLTQGHESVGGIPIAEFRHVIGKAIDNLGKKGDP